MAEIISKKSIIVTVGLLVVNVSLILSVFYYYQNFGKLTTEIVITDEDFEKGKTKKDGNEMVITDNDFSDYKEVLQTSGENNEGEIKKLGDNSEISTMSDGHGNQTLTRSFKDHSRLKKIVLRIDAGGAGRIFVYAQNGKVKNLPPSMIDSVLNSSADDIANSAKIYETREQRDRKRIEKAQRKREELKPKPSTEYPVNNENVEFPKESKPQVSEKNETDDDGVDQPKDNRPEESEEDS